MPRRGLCRFILFILLPCTAFGQVPDRKPDTYVNDYTNTLSPAEIRQLNEQLLQLENVTTVQMAIVLVDDLPSDVSIEDYAREIGNKWKVGIGHNGLVYVAALNQRIQRLEVASHLGGDIPDKTAAQMIDNLRPFLRRKEYYNALTQLIQQVNDQLQGRRLSAPADTFHEASTPAYLEGSTIVADEASELSDEWARERKEFEKKKAQYDKYGNIALWFIAGGLIGFCVWAWRYKRKYVRKNTVNGVYIGIGSTYFASTYPDYSGSQSSSDGSSGFGDFGGGGGGDFSGGGATGSW